MADLYHVPGATSRDVNVAERSSLTPSPRLSRRTQQEVVAENDTSSGEDPENYPLHSPWSFWFDKSQKGADAGDFFANLRCLATVASIKAFWRVFNNLPTCDKLRERESYHLMRSEQRRPVWEDVDNVDGGMWVIRLEKQYTVNIWQELLLAAIGEQLTVAIHPEDEICGVSVRNRYDADVIQIWNQDSELSSGSKVLDRVKELVPSLEIKNSFYQSNRDKMRDSVWHKPAKPGSGYGVSPQPLSMSAPHHHRRYQGVPPQRFPPATSQQRYPHPQLYGPPQTLGHHQCFPHPRPHQ